MTMKKTVVDDPKTWQKQTLYKGRELSKEEERVKQWQEITFQFNNFDDENRTFQAIASTPVVDRQGDSVSQDGWFVDNFVKNPVVPWAHDYSTPPVARATEIGINNQGNLQFTYQAPPEGLYEFADTIWNLYRNGFMFAFSVGFIPLDYEGDWKEGYTFTKAELLEISAVVVPANPQAVALAYKMGDITDKQAKTLFGKMSRAVKNLEEAMSKNKDAGPIDNTDEETPANEPKVEEQVVEKGALADALANDDSWIEKWNLFEPVDDVFWTFVDVWFSATESVDDWVPLLKEFAGIMMAIANGDYNPPADEVTTDDDWEDWEFLGMGLKNGVDKDKTKKLVAAMAKQYSEAKAKGLTKETKVKDNSNMTESQEADLKALKQQVADEAKANADFRKSVLEALAKGTESNEVEEIKNPVETDVENDKPVDNKPEVVTEPPVDTDEKVVDKPVEPAAAAPVAAPTAAPVATDGKTDDDVSNKEDDKADKSDQGEVKSGEESQDGADHKEEEKSIDLDDLSEEDQEAFIKFFNEEAAKLEKENEK